MVGRDGNHKRNVTRSYGKSGPNVVSWSQKWQARNETGHFCLERRGLDGGDSLGTTAVGWIWPILLWPGMGNREGRHRTNQIVFSAAHPLRRQLPAIWLVGFVITIITDGGVAARTIASGQWDAFLAWGAGAVFIPSLALALGTWSGGSKLFEVVYVLWWYLAFKERIPLLDYMGVTDEAIATGVPLYYVVFAILLLGLAVAGRRRQVQV